MPTRPVAVSAPHVRACERASVSVAAGRTGHVSGAQPQDCVAHDAVRDVPARRRLLQLLPAVAAGLALPRARAAGEPPVTLICSYPPGGGADLMARLVAPAFGEALGGRQVVVDNRPGGSGQIAGTLVARARPDGNTLLVDASSYAVTPSLFPKLPYAGLDAFDVLGVFAQFPNVLLVHPGFAARSVQELLDAAKARPDAVAFASSGNGSAQHLAGALFEKMAGVQMLHVPYKGGGPALNDVIAGQVPVFFGNLASTIQHVRAGRLRALAVTGTRRSALLPDVPTVAESGVPGYESTEWNVLAAPKGLPAERAQQLAAALDKALATPAVRARIVELGGEPFEGGRPAAQQFIAAQAKRWGDLVRSEGIRPE